MNNYAVFLRGINVGGHAAVNMQQLKQGLEEKGFSNVESHLNSGNLIVATVLDPSQTSSEIARVIKTRFGPDVDVFVKTRREIELIRDKDPFKPEEAPDMSKKVVILLSATIKQTDLARIMENQSFVEKCIAAGDVLYVYYPDGSGKSKFTVNLIERKLKLRATGRNWNTMTAMVRLFNHPSR